MYFNDRTLYSKIAVCRSKVIHCQRLQIGDGKLLVVILDYFNTEKVFFFTFKLTNVFVEFIF